MKWMIGIALLSSISAMAAECKLTGVLESSQKIETSFVTESVDHCKSMAANTKKNKFYGLVEKKDRLVETRMQFNEDAISKDVVSFESEDESI